MKQVKKTSDDNDDNNDNDDNDDSEDYQISNFVDRVLKKVSKEIVNDDNKDDDDSKNDYNKKLLKLSKKNADLKKKINILLEANKKAEKYIIKPFKIIDQIEKIKASKNLLNKQLAMLKRF